MGSDCETITVSFITNHEVDPSEVEVVEDNDGFRDQLVGAVVPETAQVQEVLGTDDDSLDRHRKRIKEAVGDAEHE